MQSSIEQIRYHDITCKSGFRKIGKRIGPYEYDMNIYRGCAHQCAYCYALYSQRYMEKEDFYHDIFIKSNILEHLQRQLASSKWTKQIISIGTVCDSYQPIEEERELMRDVLKLFIQYKNPCIISTKSDLILRDLDLIEQLANVTYVNIAATITTMDEALVSIVEPGAVSAKRRVDMLKQMRQHTNASVGLHDMPMLPYLSDDPISLEALFQAAKEIDVDYMITAPLNLMGDTRNAYFRMLQEHFLHLVRPYQAIFHGKYIDKAYIANIYKDVLALRKQYGISGNYMKKAREHFAKQEVEQLSLW